MLRSRWGNKDDLMAGLCNSKKFDLISLEDGRNENAKSS